MSPQRVQMTRQRPWRAEHPDAVIVARPSMWGNPYTVAMMREKIAQLAAAGLDASNLDPQSSAVEAFRSDLTYGPDSRWWWFGPHMAIIRMKGELQRGALRGLDLACWCPLDAPCHADVLLELANEVS